MELPNIHFRDFPIEFKKINSNDFFLTYQNLEGKRIKKVGFNVDEKIIIKPDLNGYIHNALQEKINLDEKNTVVLNTSVGSGKSYAIIQTIRRYYDSRDKYLIVVATPFVSLVEQYVNDIHKDTSIPLEDIYNYADLGRNLDIKYLGKQVQVLTVNTLLGNPGEDAFKNSYIKRKYLNDLIEYSKENKIKVIFVYDEIHDAIQNFKEEFIFNLWKWKDVIHKNFVISATFNEASKVVIEYLAELTDRKIQIIESERIRIPKKQSDLYLHYSSEHNFTNNTHEIVSVVEDLLNKNKNIDILCYSKSLAKSIIQDKQGIGKKLKDRFDELNDCTSELISNQRGINEAPTNRYSNEKCNVGTNFKTGVSIQKKNHAFVIIMPPRATRLWFRNKYGIFSDGINSIIQSLARQRKKGEIHIVLPRPDRFDLDSLKNVQMTELQINAFAEVYRLVEHFEDNQPVKYFPVNIQSYLLAGFYYDELEKNVHNEIEYINHLDRKGLTRLEFPPYNLFKLTRGEEYIANTFKFFGEDIASYITYCAFTNQFVNCNLVQINYKTDLFFREDKIQKGLDLVFNKYFGDDYLYGLMNYSNFNLAYSDFRKHLFEKFSLKYKKTDSEKWVKISLYNNKNFEIQLLRFMAIKFYGVNYYHLPRLQDRLKDLDYSRSDYMLDCISLAKDINIDEISNDESYKNRVKLFQIINHFRDKLVTKTIQYTSSSLSYSYLPNKPNADIFDESDITLFEELKALLQFDIILTNEMFEYKRATNIASFYSKILEDNFEFELSRLPIGTRPFIKKIIRLKPLPSSRLIINLIEPAQYETFEPDENWIVQNYGSIENYEANQNLIIKTLEEYFKTKD